MNRRLRTLARAAALALIGTTLTVLAGTAPANADPCNHSTFHNVWKHRTFVWKRDNGTDSYYNKPGGPKVDPIDLQFGYNLSYGETKHWVVSGGGGFDWKVVKAEIKGEYGEAYTTGVSISKTQTWHFRVPEGYTAWLRAVTYQRVVFWNAYTWRWSDKKDACVKRTIAKAYWGDRQKQWVPVYKKGRHLP